jgi:hypothetical protein
LITRPYHQQREKTHNQNYEFSGDHIRQNCAYEKTFFALKERAANRTVMFDVKRTVDKRRLTTRGAPQSECAGQHFQDRAAFGVQIGPPLLPAQIRAAARKNCEVHNRQQLQRAGEYSSYYS